MDRVYNFSPGPAVLPLPVLQQAQQDLLALPGIGISPLEISHRSPWFEGVLAETTDNLRKLLNLPENFSVLYMQGGARLQFSMVPMNLLGGGTADYIITGSWGSKAAEEARREGTVNVAYQGKSHNYSRLPAADELSLTPGAAYVHFTSNETIQGVQFQNEPEVGDVPLVCDASSDFLCRPLPMEKYGLIYACAQKNLGPAGVTLAIIRNDLLERIPDGLHSMLDYREYSENNSLANTPPVFSCYVVMLVTRWLLEQGGLAKIEERNVAKSALLYQVLDEYPDFYQGHAAADCRSTMNVTFRLPSDELTKRFVNEAAERGLCELKGHRSVGGIRASIYNAMPVDGVEKLREFMLHFVSVAKV
jgi:phosphoserine aminotransferase